MQSFGSGLPFWTPLFLLCLLILSSVWGMPLVLNKQALEDMFNKAPENGDQCRDEVNPAVKAFLSWPNNQANLDKAVPEKETDVDQLFDQQGLLKNTGEEALNSQNLDFNSENLKLNSENLELQPAALAPKEQAVLDQNKDLKAQDDSNEGNKKIKRAAGHEMLGKVKGTKSKLVHPGMMDYKREFASDEANPYVESLRQRYEPLPLAYKD